MLWFLLCIACLHIFSAINYPLKKEVDSLIYLFRYNSLFLICAGILMGVNVALPPDESFNFLMRLPLSKVELLKRLFLRPVMQLILLSLLLYTFSTTFPLASDEIPWLYHFDTTLLGSAALLQSFWVTRKVQNRVYAVLLSLLLLACQCILLFPLYSEIIDSAAISYTPVTGLAAALVLIHANFVSDSL
jgi:hypothetical protein